MAGPRGPVLSRQQMQNPATAWFLAKLRELIQPYGQAPQAPAVAPPDFTQLAAQMTPQQAGAAVADPRNAPQLPGPALGFRLQNLLDQAGQVPGQALRNAPADLAENAGLLWELAKDPGQLSMLAAQGMVGGAAKSLNLSPRGEQALLPEGVRGAMAVPEAMGQYYQDAYGSPEAMLTSAGERPVSTLLDAWDVSDLGPPSLAALGAMAKVAKLPPPRLFPGKATAKEAATEWAGLRGFYSRTAEAAQQLRPDIKLNQIINALYELGAPPSEVAAIKLKESLAELQRTLPGGQNAKVSREQVAQLIEQGTEPFTRWQELTVEPTPPRLPTRAFLKKAGWTDLNVPPPPGHAIWAEVERLAQEEARMLPAYYDRTRAETVRADALSDVVDTAQTRQSTTPPTPRRAVPGGDFSTQTFNGYFMGEAKPPLTDYGTSTWGLPPQPRTLAEEGYQVAQRPRAFLDPTRPGASDWVLLNQEGQVLMTIDQGTAPTLQDAERYFLERPIANGWDATSGTTSPWETGHYNKEVRGNILHTRTAYAPNLDALAAFEVQLDAFNQGRKEGFRQNPMVPSGRSQVVVTAGGQEAPLPVFDNDAQMQEALDALTAQNIPFRLQEFQTPAPVAEQAQLRRQLQAPRLQEQSLYNEIDFLNNPSHPDAPRMQAELAQVRARKQRLEAYAGSPPLEGGPERVGTYNRPPFDAGTAEEMGLKFLLMDAAENDLSGVFIPAGRANDQVYGSMHGAPHSEVTRGRAVGGAPAVLVANIGSLQEARQLVQSMRAEYPDATFQLNPQTGRYEVVNIPFVLGGTPLDGSPVRRSSTVVPTPDLETLTGPIASRALTDPMNISAFPGERDLGLRERLPAEIARDERRAKDYYGDDAEAVRRNMAEYESYWQENVKRNALDELMNQGEPLVPGETLDLVPVPDTPGSFRLVRRFAPPEMGALIHDVMTSGRLTPEQAKRVAESAYSVDTYRELRDQLTRMGLTPEEARALTEQPTGVLEGGKVRQVDPTEWSAGQEARVTRAQEGLTKQESLPKRYAGLREKFLAQGMTEDQATAKANKAFNVGPEGLQTGDLEKAQTELRRLVAEVQSNVAQFDWGKAASERATENLDLLRSLPRKISAETIDPGRGEMMGGKKAFWIGSSTAHPGWKLTRNYNERLIPKMKEIVERWIPGAIVHESADGPLVALDPYYRLSSHPGGQIGTFIELPPDVRARMLKPRSEGGGLPLYMLLPLLMGAGAMDAPE